MEIDPKVLEQEAHSFILQEKFEEAFWLFKKAANIYKSKGNHKQAALCFASAGSCWSKKSGEKTFYNAALIYEEAAKQADKSYDYEYASLLYKYSAINYERDGEFLNFSDCLYHSKECYRKFLTFRLLFPKKVSSITKKKEDKGIRGFIKDISLWLVLTLSYLIWGHGERPLRTFFFGVAVIFFSAFLYTLGYVFNNGIFLKPNFFEALYFSVITFTTVGFGDISPVGFTKLIVIAESICGVFIIPLLVISLSKKYLRI